MYKNFCALSW